MSESLWSIYNRAEEVRIDSLHAFQLKSVLKSFSHTSFASWLVWQEGWVDWQPLESVVDSLFPGIRDRAVGSVSAVHSLPETKLNSGVIAEQSPLTYARFNVSPSDPKKMPDVPVVTSTEFVEPNLKLETQVPVAITPAKREERRLYSRIEVPIKLFLHIDGTVVKNETSDVSLGGMRLKNTITKEPKGSFDVTMLHQGTELALKCRLLVAEGEPSKTRLLIEKCNRIEILRSWIVEPKPEQKKESA